MMSVPAPSSEGLTQPIIGQRAPYFDCAALVNGGFKNINLYNFKGKYLILFFYPMDFTFVCPTEILAFNDLYDEFKKLNCEIVGVSTDSVYCHLEWTNKPRKEGGLGPIKFPLLGDRAHDVSKSYEVLNEDGDNKGTAMRGTFIIDKEQYIKATLYVDNSIGRNVEEIKRLLEAIQFAEVNGEVCPANWTKGGPTIKPNPKEALEYFSSN